MNDEQLIDQLLQRPESDDLDFKSAPYNLTNHKKRSEFIKDIISMANTPRSAPAHIILGVTESAGRATSVLGVTEHPDEATLWTTISGKVDLAPNFRYRQVSYKDRELGLIEIDADQPGIVIPRVDYEKLRMGAVYVRRNTTNTETDSADLIRIARKFQDSPSPEPSLVAGAWEQFYRACDGFDSRRIYIAVVDRDQAIDTHDWAAMAGIPWNAIVDFDTMSDQNGNFAAAESVIRQRRSTQLTALDQSVTFTVRSTVWVAAAGLESRPSTSPISDWREWNRFKSQRLDQIMYELARVSEPMPVTMVVFGGAKDYVESVCFSADRAFTERVEYLFANPNWEHYKEIAERMRGETVAIGLPEICQGLREIQEDSGQTQEILLPKLNGGTVAVDPSRVHWVEEQLELVHRNVGIHPDAQANENAFLKGATIEWNDLHSEVDAEREITGRIESQVRKELELRATRRVNFWHRPGAGATTVARRVAWNIHRDYPTVVARDIRPQETMERIRVLFNDTRMPVLVVIDLPGMTREVVDRFHDELRRSHIPVLLFHVSRRFDHPPGTQYLDSMLTTGEAVRLSQILSDLIPSRRTDLEAIVDEKDRRKRTPFYFGLVGFGRDFTGLESYVRVRLSEASEPVGRAVQFMAFAYYYGQVSLPIQAFGPVFGIPPSKLITMSNAIPDALRELLVETQERVRPAHYLIAEEILQQSLSRRVGDRRNWNVGLADLAISFIDTLADLPHRDRGTISDTLRAVLIDRSSGESSVSSLLNQFSQFLTDVPSVDGRRRVLEHLTDCFPEEPHFWAHLGRFFSHVVKDHPRARRAYQTALHLSPDDSLLHHMVGMGLRIELYDALDSADGGYTNEEEENVLRILREATLEFEEARNLERRSEYNYISQVQMIQRVVNRISVID